MPLAIADDPTLAPTDKAILLVLAGHAWGGKATCWPSNATIAAKVGRSQGHVKRRLAALEGRGLIERQETDANRTGRVLRLLWRSTPAAPALPPPGAPARPEAESSQGKKKKRPESDSCSESTPPPAGEKGETVASADELAQLEAWARSADPVLAKFGRAGLAMAGVDEGVGIQIEPETLPPSVPARTEKTVDHDDRNRTTPPPISPKTSPLSSPQDRYNRSHGIPTTSAPKASPPSCPAALRSSSPMSLPHPKPRPVPPSSRRRDPRRILEQFVGQDPPALSAWVTRSS